MILTTNYDDALERAFENAGEPYDLITYIASSPKEHRRPLHALGSGQAAPGHRERERLPPRAPEKRTVIVKLHGAVQRPPSEDENYVITEDHYIDYLTHTDITILLPSVVTDRAAQQQLPLPRVRHEGLEPPGDPATDLGRADETLGSWAIQKDVDPIERAFWEKRSVEILELDLEEYIERLSVALDERIAEEAGSVTETATDVTHRRPARRAGAARLAVPGPEALRGGGRRLLLRARGRGGDRRGEPPRGAAHAPVRPERCRQELRPARRCRQPSARARPGRPRRRRRSRLRGGRRALLVGPRSPEDDRRRRTRGGRGAARARRPPRPARRRDAGGRARPLERAGARQAARAVRPVRGVLPLPRPRERGRHLRRRVPAGGQPSQSCGRTSCSRSATTRSRGSTASRAGSRACSTTGCRSTT